MQNHLRYRANVNQPLWLQKVLKHWPQVISDEGKYFVTLTPGLVESLVPDDWNVQVVQTSSLR